MIQWCLEFRLACNSERDDVTCGRGGRDLTLVLARVTVVGGLDLQQVVFRVELVNGLESVVRRVRQPPDRQQVRVGVADPGHLQKKTRPEVKFGFRFSVGSELAT